LSESRFPDLLETLIVMVIGWRDWNRVSCFASRGSPVRSRSRPPYFPFASRPQIPPLRKIGARFGVSRLAFLPQVPILFRGCSILAFSARVGALTFLAVVYPERLLRGDWPQAPPVIPNPVAGLLANGVRDLVFSPVFGFHLSPPSVFFPVGAPRFVIARAAPCGFEGAGFVFSESYSRAL
jgi:hypothetical protein